MVDYSLFTLSTTTHFTAILIYVDDILVAGNDQKEINKIKSFLDNKFNIKDLGDIKYYLGIEIIRTSRGFHLNQRKYALDLISEAGLTDSKPLTIPLDQNVSFNDTNGELLDDPYSDILLADLFTSLLPGQTYLIQFNLLVSSCKLPELLVAKLLIGYSNILNFLLVKVCFYLPTILSC